MEYITGMDNMASEEEKQVSMHELLMRVQDLEARMPEEKAPNSDEVPIRQLPNSASLGNVISAVNELIKRNLTLKRVK